MKPETKNKIIAIMENISSYGVDEILKAEVKGEIAQVAGLNHQTVASYENQLLFIGFIAPAKDNKKWVVNRHKKL